MDAITWIEDDTSLVRAVDAIRDGPLAVDTEADSFHHYREKVCLIQLTFADTTALVDPLAGLDVGPLAGPLGNAGVRIVLHGADYDLRLLHRDFGLSVAGLFDTMIAGRLVGERAFGLAALLDAYLGVRLDKSHQLADWSQRPLPDKLVRYAADDTRHLLELAARLENRLRELGRLAWAHEEFARLESVRWASTEDPDPEAFRRVKGASRLDREQLAVLRELFAWRDETARRRDVPPFRVAGDGVLAALAASPPHDRDALTSVRGAPRRWSRGREADELLERVRRGQAVPPEARPEPPARRSRRTDPVVRARVGRLRRERDGVAERLGLDPTLLATRAQLEAVAARQAAGEDWTTVEDLRAWQIRLLEPVLG